MGAALLLMLAIPKTMRCFNDKPKFLGAQARSLGSCKLLLTFELIQPVNRRRANQLGGGKT
jgi:hypothetical protein